MATRPAAFPWGGAGLPRRETRVAEVFFVGVIVRALLAFPAILLRRHVAVSFLKKPVLSGRARALAWMACRQHAGHLLDDPKSIRHPNVSLDLRRCGEIELEPFPGF